jgi:protein-tyrosine phosphatase
MTPLADTHVHLLAGLDDGPPTRDVALAMCRMLVAEGARHATALAHQHEGYPDNTADRLRAAAALLVQELAAQEIPLSIYPTGEVMLSPTTFDDWQAGKLLSVGDRKQWLLVEMPHGTCLDILPIADAFRPLGVRLIVAHAERYPELLDDLGLTAQWIAAGCLIQVTARSLAEPWEPGLETALKRWAQGGFVHVLGSDGHGIDRRQPVLAAGFERLVKWVGQSAAERIASLWGVAVLQGLPLNVPPPKPPSRSWFSRLFGG